MTTRCEVTERIEAQLWALQDEKYRLFQAKLMPNVAPERIIGVRTPALRAMAKALAKQPETVDFLNDLPHRYYDENNLHGFIVAEGKDYRTVVAQVDALLPHVDNWATCDLLSPKVFRKNRALLAQEIERWLDSKETYTLRFGIEMVMSHYLDEDFAEYWLERIAPLRSEEYYVNMMLAWFFATALAKQWEATLPYLTGQRLAVWVHNKTIQKAIESDRITPAQKEYLRTLKRR